MRERAWSRPSTAPRRRSADVRRPSPAVLGWAGLTTLLCILVGYLTWLTALSQSGEGADGPARVPVTVAIEKRTLVDGVRLACTAERPVVAKVSDAREDGVVSAVDVRRRRVSGGELVAEIDGRALVAVQGQVPMFRDIAPGTVGADVDQVRSMLAGRGLVAEQPARTPWRASDGAAWKALLRSLGQRGGATVRQDEVLVVAALPAQVSWPVSALGSRDLDRLTLRSGDERVTCPLAAGAPDVRESMAVRLVGQRGTSARIRSVRPGQDGEPGSVIVEVTGGDLADGAAVVAVVERARARGPALVVPVSALWEAAGNVTQVRVAAPDSGAREVPVTTGFAAGGLVEVRPVRAGALSEGDHVVIGTDAPGPTASSTAGSTQ